MLPYSEQTPKFTVTIPESLDIGSPPFKCWPKGPSVYPWPGRRAIHLPKSDYPYSERSFFLSTFPTLVLGISETTSIRGIAQSFNRPAFA